MHRPEIDGLRAIAVSLVIIFHAGLGTPAFAWVPGGLVGVDVFFVISGYLITNIIQQDLDKFSLREFYERRTRRIMPALFLVVLCAIPIAYFVLLPRPFYEFSSSARSAIVFLSNIFFWRLNSYTAEINQYQPLLHTWSLGVEEQFYILYPVALVFLSRLHRRSLTPALIVAFALSLLLMIWGGSHHPSATFYLLPTRCWELMAGALLARAERSFGRAGAGAAGLRGIPTAIGLLAILGSSFFLGEHLQQPGIFSVVPVLGAALLIWFAHPHDATTRLLSSRPLAGLGLISYSLYLWHQPVLAFARILSPDQIEAAQVFAQLAVVLVVSWLSWRFIEKPFRDRNLFQFKTVAIVLLTSALLIVISTLVMDTNKRSQEAQPIGNMLIGGYQEIALQQNDAACHARSATNACRFGPADAPERWYVVGDSHASVLSASLYPALQKMRRVHYIHLTTGGCPYAPGLYREKKDIDGCNGFSGMWRTELLSAPPSIVVITGRLPLYLNGVGYDNGEGGIEPREGIFLTTDPTGQAQGSVLTVMEALTKALQELVDHGHRLVLVYPPPEPGWDIPRHYANLVNDASRGWGAGAITTSYSRFLERSKLAYAVYDAVQGESVVRVYAEKEFCNTVNQGRCTTHSRTEIYYRDDNHLSLYGANLVANRIVQNIANH